MFRSRQLELREEARGGRIKKSSVPFSTAMEIEALKAAFKQLFPPTPAERKKSDYLAQVTCLSGELI